MASMFAADDDPVDSKTYKSMWQDAPVSKAGGSWQFPPLPPLQPHGQPQAQRQNGKAGKSDEPPSGMNLLEEFNQGIKRLEKWDVAATSADAAGA